MNANIDTPVALHAETVRELMTHNPLSIQETATVREAADFLYKNKISAGPVIDASGRPVGVISLSDLVWYQHVRGGEFVPPQGFYFTTESEMLPPRAPHTHEAAHVVRDIMTPAVFSVKPGDPVLAALKEMHRSKVHRLFVIDEAGTLVGVVSASDVVRDLCECADQKAVSSAHAEDLNPWSHV